MQGEREKRREEQERKCVVVDLGKRLSSVVAQKMDSAVQKTNQSFPPNRDRKEKVNLSSSVETSILVDSVHWQNQQQPTIAFLKDIANPNDYL